MGAGNRIPLPTPGDNIGRDHIRPRRHFRLMVVGSARHGAKNWADVKLPVFLPLEHRWPQIRSLRNIEAAASGECWRNPDRTTVGAIAALGFIRDRQSLSAVLDVRRFADVVHQRAHVGVEGLFAT